MATTQRGLTLDEFLALPEEKPALEYVDGVVSQKVAAEYEHSVLQVSLMIELDRLLGPSGLVRVLPELRTTYGGRSYVPDVSVYRRERLPRGVRGQRVGELLILPDLAIEIRSPGQSRTRLVERCQWYVDHGAQAALLVDDSDESIRIFRANQAAVVRRRGDRIALHDVAPELELDVDAVFSALDPD